MSSSFPKSEQTPPAIENQQCFERLEVKRKSSPKDVIISFLLILAGMSVVTFGLNYFVIPAGLLDGGVVGIALLAAQLLGGGLGVWLAVLSVPFLAAGYFYVGKGFAIKSSAAIGLLIVFVSVVPVKGLTDEPVLAAVFGGCFLGLGVGLTMRASAVLDGTEILALILSKRSAFGVGEIILALNIVIFFAAALLTDVEKALFSLLTYFCAAKMIDFVLHGFEAYNGITIISNDPDTVRKEIVSQTGRGVTVFKGKGGFTDEEKQILYCVVTRLEVPAIKSAVGSIDPQAFILVHTLNEASGGMFKRGSIH